tara:strand:- start:61 stop:342 length:282 start_codon:yes stop_codon:yes gene_type:complete
MVTPTTGYNLRAAAKNNTKTESKCWARVERENKYADKVKQPKVNKSELTRSMPNATAGEKQINAATAASLLVAFPIKAQKAKSNCATNNKAKM